MYLSALCFDSVLTCDLLVYKDRRHLLNTRRQSVHTKRCAHIIDANMVTPPMHAYPWQSDMYLYNYHYTIFDQRRVDIIEQVEYGVHDRLHIYPVWNLLLPLA